MMIGGNKEMGVKDTRKIKSPQVGRKEKKMSKHKHATQTEVVEIATPEVVEIATPEVVEIATPELDLSALVAEELRAKLEATIRAKKIAQARINQREQLVTQVEELHLGIQSQIATIQTTLNMMGDPLPEWAGAYFPPQPKKGRRGRGGKNSMVAENRKMVAEYLGSSLSNLWNLWMNQDEEFLTTVAQLGYNTSGIGDKDIRGKWSDPEDPEEEE